MFFQLLIYIGIALGAVWLVWNFVLKDIFEANEEKLNARGIILEDPKEIKTDYTKKLEELQKKHAEISASTDAVEEAVEIQKDIEWMERKIEEANSKM